MTGGGDDDEMTRHATNQKKLYTEWARGSGEQDSVEDIRDSAKKAFLNEYD
jgi:hypothetical protein